MHEILAQLQGPFALFYWCRSARSFIFGRDPFGRRSLLMRYSPDLQLFFLSSVAVPLSEKERATSVLQQSAIERSQDFFKNWIELNPHYLYTLSYSPLTGAWNLQTTPYSTLACNFHLSFQSHPSRTESPTSEILSNFDWDSLIFEFCRALHGSVKKRVVALKSSVTSVLFSGGIDSVLLTAIIHLNLPSEIELELINVAFAKSETMSFRSPDRKAALRAVEDLKRMFPSRKWMLKEVLCHSNFISQR